MLLNRLSTEKNRCITLLGIHRSMILNIFYSSPRKKEKKTIWQQKINRNKSDWKKKKKKDNTKYHLSQAVQIWGRILLSSIIMRTAKGSL